MRLSHAEAQALVSARLDGPLDPVAERELNAHLATCDSCRAFNASATQLARRLQALPYLPASPAVTRAVLDHVNTPRSPLSWITGSLPGNALPAAAVIAVAVIVVFVGSFAAFGLLDEEDEPSTIPASTLSVNDLAQRPTESDPQNAVSAPTGTVEGQTSDTEAPAPPTEAVSDPGAAGDPTEAAFSEDVQETEPPLTSGTSDTLQLELSTETPEAEPSPEPTDAPAPTRELTAEVTPSPGPALRRILGLETVVPTEAPTAIPTDVPTLEPSPTVAPTEEPTQEPTISPTPTDEPSPTREPTLEPTPVPTEEPAPVATESESNLSIVESPPTATSEPTIEPTAEPTSTPTVEPTPEPTTEPTPFPTEESTAEPTVEPTVSPTEEPTPEPTPTTEPTPEPTLDPTVEPTPTVIPIEQRDEPAEGDSKDEETPDAEPELIGDDAPEVGTGESGDGGDDPSGGENRIQEIAPNDEAGDLSDGDGPAAGSEGDDEGEVGDATPASEQIIQEIESAGDDGDEQVILPAGGDDSQPPDDAEETPGDGTGEASENQAVGGNESTSLTDAEVYASIGDIPGDPGERLGLSAGGDLIFSPYPGRVSLLSNGISLETVQGSTGQVVQACDGNGSCVDISSGSSNGGTTDTPIGWLDGEIIYERLNGDEYPVEFRAVSIDPATLQPVDHRLLGGADSDLGTLIRPYLVDGGLLVPTPSSWLWITLDGVNEIDANPYGGGLGLIRINQGLGTISYVAGGSLVVASLDAPGIPITQLPFDGVDYVFSPDGSRVAVVTGSGIEILDTSGSVLATYPNDEGISLGGLAWLNQGLVFADLSNGVLRIIQP